MREIKFRAWNLNDRLEDKRLKEMVCFDFFGIDGDKINSLGCIDKNTIIMQYTGLKDKQGKEIYEGDIIKTLKSITTMMGNQNVMALAEVIFETSAFRFKFGDEMPLVHSGCEIIGNIYENPELLEKK